MAKQRRERSGLGWGGPALGCVALLLAAVAFAQPPTVSYQDEQGRTIVVPGNAVPAPQPGQPEAAPPAPGQPGATAPAAPSAPASAPATPGPGPAPANAEKSLPTDAENLPRKQDGKIAMTFENADISAVLRALSEIWGKTIAIHPNLTGSMTIIAPQQVTPAEALEILRTALNVHGFTVRGDLTDQTKVIEIWPQSQAASLGGTVGQGNDPNQIADNMQIITQVMELRYRRAGQLAESLKPLLSKDSASVIALDDSNSLVITDTGNNVRRVMEVVALIDKVPEDRRTVEVVRLVHANANEVQRLLNDLFTDPMAAMQQQMGRGRGGQGGMPPGAENMMQMMGALKATDTVKITADERTNSLIVYGPPELLKTLRETIQELDQDISRQVVFKRYNLQYADAAQVANSLNQLFQQPEGGPSGRQPIWFQRWGGNDNTPDRGFTGLKENQVLADLRTNSVLITATPENQRIYEDLIRGMDQPSMVQDVVEVIPLEFAQAQQVETSLRRLLRGSDSGRGFMFFIFGDNRSMDSPLEQLRDVTVVAEQTSNSLIISGPAETLPTVRRLIAGLDQPQAQVYISVIIADVTLGDGQQLGVELSWTHAPTSGDHASSNFNLNSVVPQGIRYALMHGEFSALLRALSDKQKVKVLSTPHVTGINNRPATISIGQRFPFPRSQSDTISGNVVANFDLQDIVIQLDVLPRVSLGSQMVTLNVDQQIDELTGTVRQGNFDLPLIATRRATTDVMVESGQTVVIGGIIRDKSDKRRSGIPLLQDIPILGNLFRYSSERTERTELMVFLTPFVVTTDEQLRVISEQRQQQLDQEFPQLREYIQQQQGLSGERPPDPLAPQPEPQPLPATPPTPRTAPQPQPPAAPATQPLPIRSAPLGPPAPGTPSPAGTQLAAREAK